MSFPSDYDKRVLIPVVLKSGKWEPFYEGEMPELKEGAMADLYVSEHSFCDPKQVRRFSAEKTVALLPEGTRMWASISRMHGTTGPKDPGLNGNPAIDGPEHGSFLVGFTIMEELRLRLRGTKQAQFEPCECALPGFDIGPVTSINQAYTRLSERYEPKRKSHSGNAFQKVFFQDAGSGKARPLDELRVRAVREWEKSVAKKPSAEEGQKSQ